MAKLNTRILAAVAAASAFGIVGPAMAADMAPSAHFEPVRGDAGVLRTKSDFDVAETVTRLKADIAAKGIRFFDEIDQQKLAQGANVEIGPSVLLIFGNPPLGTQFLSANPYAGLDWPVRILVFQDKAGQVWIAYSDFGWIAHRHGIKNRQAQFKMATGVVASISAAAQKHGQ